MPIVPSRPANPFPPSRPSTPTPTPAPSRPPVTIAPGVVLGPGGLQSQPTTPSNPFPPSRPSGGGGGGGHSGGSSSGGGSSQVTTPASNIPIPQGGQSFQPAADPLGGQNPVYQNGVLLGFTSPTGAFIPKETALTSAGTFKPQDVKANVISNGQIQSYGNLSGGGSTKLVSQGSNLFYNVSTPQGFKQYSSKSNLPVVNKETTTTSYNTNFGNAVLSGFNAPIGFINPATGKMVYSVAGQPIEVSKGVVLTKEGFKSMATSSPTEIFTRNIQVSNKDKEKTIRAGKGFSTQDPMAQYGLWGAIKQSAKNVVNPPYESGDFGDYRKAVFEPFYNVNYERVPIIGGINIGKINPNTIGGYKGTKIDEANLPFKYKDWSKLSEGQIYTGQQIEAGIAPRFVGVTQKAANVIIAKEVSKSIQKDIDSGKIAFETEADKKAAYDLANKRIEEQIKAYNFKNLPAEQRQAMIVEAKKKPAELIQLGVETAILSGVSALPEVKFATGVATDTLFRTEGGLLSEGSFLKNWIAEDYIKQLSKIPTKISGAELAKNTEGSVFSIFGERALPSAKQSLQYELVARRIVNPDVFATTESGAKVLVEKGSTKNVFDVIKGKSSTTVVSDIFAQPYKAEAAFNGGGIISNVGDKSMFWSKGLGVELKETQSGIGTGYIKQQGKEGFKQFKFFGLTKETPEFYNVAGGTPKGVKLTDTGINVRGKITNYGQISKLPENPIIDITFEPIGGQKATGGLGGDTIKLYHGTSDKFLGNIMETGLKPSKSTGIYQGVAQPLEYVSTGESLETAKGFATRTALKQGGKPVILEINIPKSDISKYAVESSKISGVGEVRLKEIPSQYLSTLTEQKPIAKGASPLFASSATSEAAEITLPTFQGPTVNKLMPSIRTGLGLKQQVFTKTYESNMITPVNALSLIQLNEQKNKIIPDQTSILDTTPINKDKLIPSLTQPQIQTPQQEQTQQLGFFVPSPPVQTPNIPFGFVGASSFDMPFLGSPQVGGGQRIIGLGGKGGGKPRYNPSLGSVLFGGKTKKVTAKEYEKLSNLKYSGLENRPLLEIVPEGKKKKKKNKK